LLRLCQAGLDARTFAVEAVQRLRAAIPVDAFFWATADPSTLLFTGSVVDEIPERVTPLFLTNEFLQDDVNKFVQLARRRDPVDSLYRATAGEPEHSPRYRDILAPLGFGDELRAALVDGRSCWGFLCLHRERSGPGFTADEGQVAEAAHDAACPRPADRPAGRQRKRCTGARRAGHGDPGGRSLRGRDDARG